MVFLLMKQIIACQKIWIYIPFRLIIWDNVRYLNNKNVSVGLINLKAPILFQDRNTKLLSKTWYDFIMSKNWNKSKNNFLSRLQ